MPVIYNYTGSLDKSPVLENINERGIGILYPLGSGNQPINRTTNTIDTIRSNILLLLQTERGERVMRPDFGIKLREYLFAPNIADLIPSISKDIQSSIERWIPEVYVKKIDITPAENNLNISIVFVLKQNTDKEYELKTNLS